MKKSDIQEGSGVVTDREGKRVAIAKVNGVIATLSPVCSHAGCEVEWNANEKTWDCPCHGSVYTADGSVINGPAEEPLERVTMPFEDE